MTERTNLKRDLFTANSGMNLRSNLGSLSFTLDDVNKEKERMRNSAAVQRALRGRFPELEGVPYYLLIEIARLQDEYVEGGPDTEIKIAHDCRHHLQHISGLSFLILTRVPVSPRRVKRALRRPKEFRYVPLDPKDRRTSEWEVYQKSPTPTPSPSRLRNVALFGESPAPIYTPDWEEYQKPPTATLSPSSLPNAAPFGDSPTPSIFPELPPDSIFGSDFDVDYVDFEEFGHFQDSGIGSGYEASEDQQSSEAHSDAGTTVGLEGDGDSQDAQDSEDSDNSDNSDDTEVPPRERSHPDVSDDSSDDSNDTDRPDRDIGGITGSLSVSPSLHSSESFTSMSSVKSYSPDIAAIPPPMLPLLLPVPPINHTAHPHRCEACIHLNSLAWRLGPIPLRDRCERCGMPRGDPSSSEGSDIDGDED